MITLEQLEEECSKVSFPSEGYEEAVDLEVITNVAFQTMVMTYRTKFYILDLVLKTIREAFVKQ